MQRKFKLFLVAAIAAAVVLAWLRYTAIRDDLNAQRQAIGEKWTRVESALDRRAGALPNLAEAAGHLAPEAPLVRELTRSRTDLEKARGPARKIRANREVSQVLAKILLHCDTDSALRQSAAFRTLRESMASYDDEIAHDRFDYNNALEHYNAQLQRFPANMVALIAGYARDDSYFGTGPDASIAPNLLH